MYAAQRRYFILWRTSRTSGNLFQLEKKNEAMETKEEIAIQDWTDNLVRDNNSQQNMETTTKLRHS